jgi:RNA polymerase sigma-70 factor (ECF subfamily)
MLAGKTVLIAAALLAAGGQPLTVASAPPVVVKTEPESGATGVAATTTEIRVTFSKPMKDGSWSWNTVPDATFPTLAGQPRYEKDQRTCVLPVKLQPGKTYGVWLNSPSARNFRDADGRSAVPYLLVFDTGSGGTETRVRFPRELSAGAAR